jgi:hypothetical protein
MPPGAWPGAGRVVEQAALHEDHRRDGARQPGRLRHGSPQTRDLGALAADRGLLLGLRGMPARLLSSALHVLRPGPAKLHALPQGREVKHTASWGSEVFASAGSRMMKMIKLSWKLYNI